MRELYLKKTAVSAVCETGLFNIHIKCKSAEVGYFIILLRLERSITEISTVSKKKPGARQIVRPGLI